MPDALRRAAALAAAATMALALAAAPAVAGDLLDRAGPYVLITTDGFRIDAMAPPEKSGGKARIRLAPHGQLTVMPAGRIDWEATERFNARRSGAEAAGAPSPQQERADSLVSSAGRELDEPVHMTIIGTRSSSSEGSGREPAGSRQGEAGVRPAVPEDPARVAAELAGLRRQMAAIRDAYLQSVQSRDELQARRAELQQKLANEPPSSGVQDYKSPSRKAMEQVQERLEGLSGKISTLERRMNDLRFRAVELGGSLD